MAEEIISRVSTGSKMDQIYIPKNRIGLASGSVVIVKAIGRETNEIRKEKIIEKPFIYGFVKEKIEPIKLEIIKRVFSVIEKNISSENLENIIITGSFLESGFNFNDIDVLVVSEKKIDERFLIEKMGREMGISIHLISLSSKALLLGLSSDPLYENMLSKFVSLKRVVFNYKRKINSQLLDAHLIKSKSLIDGFEMLNGREKYYLILNLMAILLFLEGKRISKEAIKKKIKDSLNVKEEEIKENILDQNEFIKKYKEVYYKTSKLIEKNGAK